MILHNVFFRNKSIIYHMKLKISLNCLVSNPEMEHVELERRQSTREHTKLNRTIKLMSLCTKTCRYFACSFNSMRRYPKLNQTNIHMILLQKLQNPLFQVPRVFSFDANQMNPIWQASLSLPLESSFYEQPQG